MDGAEEERSGEEDPQATGRHRKQERKTETREETCWTDR